MLSLHSNLGWRPCRDPNGSIEACSGCRGMPKSDPMEPAEVAAEVFGSHTAPRAQEGLDAFMNDAGLRLPGHWDVESRYQADVGPMRQTVLGDISHSIPPQGIGNERQHTIPAETLHTFLTNPRDVLSHISVGI
jgi:hypothetical protein